MTMNDYKLSWMTTNDKILQQSVWTTIYDNNLLRITMYYNQTLWMTMHDYEWKWMTIITIDDIELF